MGQFVGRPQVGEQEEEEEQEQEQEEQQEETDDPVISSQTDARAVTADAEEFHVGETVLTSTPERARRVVKCGVM